MKILDFLSEGLGVYLTPAVLLLSAFVLLPHIPLRRLLGPVTFFRTLRDRPDDARTSPAASLSLALAGTLGVGNITGVTSALLSGGPGAVFWMWTGAVVSIVVKYAEVFLAVKFRREDRRGKYGGAMYYIRDGLRLSENRSVICGGIFAVLCCVNSLVTGNIVQANAAACIFPERYRLTCGFLLAAALTASIFYGRQRMEKITSRLMPPLTAAYMLLSGTVLVKNAALLPEIFSDILRCAFAPHAFLGGTAGFTLREALRCGVMRGIFSNEIYIIGLGHNLSKREVFWPYFYGYRGIQNDNRYDCISPSGFAAPLPCSPRQTA